MCVAWVAMLVLGSTNAGAVEVSEPPVLKPLSVTQPTNLKVGSPRNEVQRLTVHATGGTYRLTGVTKVGAETTEPIPYNASALDVQEAITRKGMSYCFSLGGEGQKTVVVTEEATGVYIITEMPSEPSIESGAPREVGDRPEPLFTVDAKELQGSASVTEVTRGQFEPIFTLSVTDVGGPTNGGQITLEDTLPPGITATRIESYETYAAPAHFPGETGLSCSPQPEIESPLTCTSTHEMVTGDALIVRVHVRQGNPAGVYENHLTVSGGGAAPVSVKPRFTVSDTPAAYGPAPNSVIAATSTEQAGAHPSVITAFTMNTDEFGHVAENEKDIRFDFPPGLVGSTVGLPKCAASKILEFKCPKSAMVGMATLDIALQEGELPLTFTTPIYAIEPAPGEPVAFAFSAIFIPVRLDTSILSGGATPQEQNYGVRVTAPGLSESAATFSSWITIWGDPAEHKGPAPGHFEAIGEEETQFGGPNPGEVRVPLLTNPQQCGTPMEALMSTDSWTKQGVYPSESATMGPFIGCELLRLDSSFTMLPDTLEAGEPAGYGFDLNVPQNEGPDAFAPSTVKTVKLSLPVGTVISPSAAWGLQACSDAQFGLHAGSRAECPRAAQVGTVQIKTPALLEGLRGQVYLASPPCDPCSPRDAEEGKMVRLFVQAVTEGESGIIIKLEGKASINQQTGQITASFEENPPLPFSEFKLNLGGGPRATLANPRQCGPATTTMDMTPWSNPFIPDSTPSYSFEVNQDCFGEQFNPTVVAGTTSIQSGEYSPFTLSFARDDRDGFLAGLQQRLPAGVLGKITGITLCQEPQAAEGVCPENSLIGHVQALTGPGADPFLVSGGRIFLTGPYKGAPFGLSIVVPAAAGPYTLSGTTGRGTVVVRAAINVDPSDAHLTVTADPLPVELDGIPLQLKVVNVTIDRPGFTFNPTNCAKLAIHTTLSSQEGMVSNLSSPFQVTNCVGLGFKPKFKVSTSGRTSRARGASLDAKVIYPPGQKLANIAHVKVELPRQLPSRLTTLQKACPDSTFDADPKACPAASRVGQARASTPVLPNELTGWAYFVSHGGMAFPSLTVVLQDRQDGVRVDLVGDTFISKAGITSTTFANVPDVPISSFELYLPQGRNSALAAIGNLCKRVLKMPTTFTGQNGAVLKQSTPIAVTGCAKAAKRRVATPHKKLSRGDGASPSRRHHNGRSK
jgi:hypothetical protein